MIPPGARSFLSVVLTTVSVAFCTRTKRGVSSAAGRARLAARRGPDAGARSSFFFLKLSPQNTKTLMIFFLIEIDKESVNRDSGRWGTHCDSAGIEHDTLHTVGQHTEE